MTETTNPITQKDLELLDDLVPADDKPAEPAADAAKPESDKPAAKGSDSLFDGLDDDDGKGDAKAKAGEGADDKAKPADGDDAKDESGDKKAAEDKAVEDAAWRERAADKILAPLKDKLSQAKFEKRREQLLGQFKRYKTPDDAIIAGVMAQEKLRSGEHKKLSEDASPEEAAAWRKENDIPEAADKYDIPAIPGHTWKDADTPALDGFKAAAHEANLPQSAVNRLTKWYVEQQQNSEAEYDSKLKKLDIQDKEACHDALRTEFGIAEFKPSLSVMKRLIEDPDVFGEDMAEILVGSRYFDEETGMWRRLTSHPSFARGLIGLATERYGEGAMVAGDGRPSVTANRLEEIEKILKTDSDRYFREGLADEAMAIRQKQEERERKRAARR